MGRIREEDDTAYDQLNALVRMATWDGIPPTRNNNHPSSKSPTHRCPVGDHVEREIPDHGFNPKTRPKPWAGELYAESHDLTKLYRTYFIESRVNWTAETDRVVGSGAGWKSANGEVDHLQQTREICDAMNSGVTWCTNRSVKWRRAADA